MNEKEMILHIKSLTKIIEKQFEYNEQLMRKFLSLDRELSILQVRLARQEGIKKNE